MNSKTLSIGSIFTHARVLVAVVVLAFALLAVPAPARAAGLTAEQVQAVVSLLESFNTDQATLLRVSRALGATTTSSKFEDRGNSTERASLCGLLHRQLKRGSSGDDVKALQKILAEDKDVYAEGMVTGYFGEHTEVAIKRLQAKLGIVASGDAATTGYGMVGAKTRAALIARCADNSGKGNMKTFRAMPDKGVAPLSVRFSVGAAALERADLVIDFGDGTKDTVVGDVTHVYKTPGRYMATLSGVGMRTCIATSTACERRRAVLGVVKIQVTDTSASDDVRGHDDDNEDEEEDEDSDDSARGAEIHTLSRAGSAATGVLLAAAMTSVSLPFTLITDALSDALFQVGLY